MKIYTYDFLLKNILRSNKDEIEELISNKEELYTRFEIPKKGGTREIHALKEDKKGKKLALMQKNLCQRFFNKLPIASPAKGFVRGESYPDFLEPHLGNTFFMRVDIKDFFPAFSEEMLENMLKEYIEPDDARKTVIEICTLAGRLPQGVCTSPVLSNLLFRRTDQRILKYCQIIEERQWKKRRNCPSVKYTRYADDMLFSSDFIDFREDLYFYHMLTHILESNGFEINRRKTVMGKDILGLNGYMLADRLHLSRTKLRNIKRILYFFRMEGSDRYVLNKKCFEDVNKLLKGINDLGLKDREGEKKFENFLQLINYLCGYRSWLISICQIDGDVRKVDKKIPILIRRIEMVLRELEKLEER